MRVIAFVAGAFLAACSTLEVHTDHDPRADFSKYKTYAWAPELALNRPADISGVPSQLVEQRIHASVDARLAAKGLKRVGSEERPDLLVVDHMTVREVFEESGASGGFAYGFGSGSWVGGIGFPVGGGVDQYSEGTLVLDFVDGDSRQLVWRGIATDAIQEPDQSVAAIDEAIAKTLERYPPETKKG